MSNALFQHARYKFLNAQTGIFVSGAVTNAGLIRLTTATVHGLATSDIVAVMNVGGVPNATGVWTITVIDSTHVDLQGSTFAGSYTSGGEIVLPDALQKKNGQIIRWGVGSSGVNSYGDDIKALLVNVSGAGTIYVPDLIQHEFLSDVIAAISGSGSPPELIGTVATPSTPQRIALVNKASSTGSAGTFAGGVADADDIVFLTVGPVGASIEALILFKDTGTDSTSPVIAYIDTATGLAVTANGGNITVAWDSGANRIYVL